MTGPHHHDDDDDAGRVHPFAIPDDTEGPYRKDDDDVDT